MRVSPPPPLLAISEENDRDILFIPLALSATGVRAVTALTMTYHFGSCAYEIMAVHYVETVWADSASPAIDRHAAPDPIARSDSCVEVPRAFAQIPERQEIHVNEYFWYTHVSLRSLLRFEAAAIAKSQTEACVQRRQRRCGADVVLRQLFKDLLGQPTEHRLLRNASIVQIEGNHRHAEQRCTLLYIEPEKNIWQSIKELLAQVVESLLLERWRGCCRNGRWQITTLDRS
jgi:hypothetical protein